MELGTFLENIPTWLWIGIFVLIGMQIVSTCLSGYISYLKIQIMKIKNENNKTDM